MGLIQSRQSHHLETKACGSTLNWSAFVSSAVYVPHKLHLHSFLTSKDEKHYQGWSFEEEKNVAYGCSIDSKMQQGKT